jgi:hypothetical protein
MPHLAAKPNRMGAWLQQLLARSHPNVVVVALAAKLARIVWAVLRHETNFDQDVPVAARSQRTAAGQDASPLMMSARVRTDGITVEPAARRSWF